MCSGYDHGGQVRFKGAQATVMSWGEEGGVACHVRLGMAALRTGQRRPACGNTVSHRPGSAVEGGFAEDAGFAINGGNGWSNVVFRNHQVTLRRQRCHSHTSPHLPAPPRTSLRLPAPPLTSLHLPAPPGGALRQHCHRDGHLLLHLGRRWLREQGRRVHDPCTRGTCIACRVHCSRHVGPGRSHIRMHVLTPP